MSGNSVDDKHEKYTMEILGHATKNMNGLTSHIYPGRVFTKAGINAAVNGYCITSLLQEHAPVFGIASETN